MLKATAVAGLAQIAAPAIITARGEANIKIGLDNPLTGPFAAFGKNELIGCQLAVEQINAKGGILGRQVDLLVEDSTSGEAARGAEGQQTDRARSGELPARQHQFGAGAGDGECQL